MISVSETKYFVKVEIKALLKLKMEEEKEGKMRRRDVAEERRRAKGRVFFRWLFLYRGIMVIV